MADDIRVDKIIMREAVRGCLDRLMSQNYIGRTGDTYNFLTDEEQDIQREIRDTNVDTASIVERIAQMIYGDIFTTKKLSLIHISMAMAKNLIEMLVPFVKESVGEINLSDRTLTMEKTDGEIAEDNLDWKREADMDAALDFADSF